MSEESKIVKVDGKEYRIVDDQIQKGDLCYNENANVVDECLDASSDEFITVRFPSGPRASIRRVLYKKAIEI